MTTQKLLVAGPSWVGDMVMAQSLFMLLKRNGASRIDVLAPHWSLPVIARMPEVRRGVAVEAGHGQFAFGQRRALGKSLKNESYDQAIILPRSFKSALIPWFAGIPRRTGYRGEMRYGLINDMRTLDKSRLDQTVKRFLALGSDDGSLPEQCPEPALSVHESRQRQLVANLGLDTSLPVVALMPGAEYGPAKCWPLEYFAELANLLAKQGFSVWIFGSDKDRSAGRYIATNSAAIDLCGRTAMEDAVDLIAACRHAVTNDSGLMHVAAAVGVHVHAIYGSSTPRYTPPLTGRRRIHYMDLDCSPCFKRDCPLGHTNCLKKISPNEVLNGVKNVAITSK